MLLGQQITVHTCHKKITYTNTNISSDRVLQQHLVIEEFGAEIVYFPGEKHVVANALLRLDSKTQRMIFKEESIRNGRGVLYKLRCDQETPRGVQGTKTVAQKQDY